MNEQLQTNFRKMKLSFRDKQALFVQKIRGGKDEKEATKEIQRDQNWLKDLEQKKRKLTREVNELEQRKIRLTMIVNKLLEKERNLR